MTDKPQAPDGDEGASPAPNPWRIVIVLRNVKERRKLVAAYNEFTKDADEGHLFPWFARFIKAWPYKLDPSKEASYDELTLDQMDDVQGEFSRALESFRPRAV